MKTSRLLVIFVISLFIILYAQADKSHYTTVNQLGLTVTNYGVFGEYYQDSLQPSCMYKQFSEDLKEQVEHMSWGGLWVGGILNGDKKVTTAVCDGVFSYGNRGFEFTDNGNPITERSSISGSSYYSPEAVSHQDFLTTYYDTAAIENHNPLNLKVDQTTYAWDHSNAEAFIIVNYQISNIGIDTIRNVYVGFWADVAVGNMNYTSIYVPGGGWTWYDNLNGFDESVFDPVPGDTISGNERDIAYSYDVDGDSTYAQSYVGFSFLGSEGHHRKYWDTYYNQWKWNTSLDNEYPAYIMPLNDAQRYDKLSTSVPKGTDISYNEDGYPSDPASWMALISAGPFGTLPLDPDSSTWALPPGESFNVAMTVVCATWANDELSDSQERRIFLYTNADWAQRLYNGEDKNWNEKLDPGEDLNGNGVIDRYVFLEYSSIDESLSDPVRFQLYSSYPNPFNPTTTISYELSSDMPVNLSVYDISGRKIATLVDEYQSSGFHSLKWDASEFSSGIYLYQLTSGSLIETEKMLLIK